MTNHILNVENLRTRFQTPDGEVEAVNDVNFHIDPGETLGVVGESGSGKTQIFLAVMGLLAKNGKATGTVRYKDSDILNIPSRQLNKIRGVTMSMIFQDPMTSLNPFLKISKQMTEVLVEHRGMSEGDALKRAINMLDRVGIPGAAQRVHMYPHEFSGGMRQRVMIAMALANNPRLLIADEPTTALDVTIQAQILELMLDVQNKREGSSIILITHDLAVVAEMCDRVAVMYGGMIQEIGSVRQIFKNPLHPYTQGLLDSIPHPEKGHKVGRLRAIQGNVPNIMKMPHACKFNTRCEHAMSPLCFDQEPGLAELEPGHFVRCHLYEESTQAAQG